MSDADLLSLGDGLAAMFVDTACARCGALTKTLPQNPRAICEACIPAEEFAAKRAASGEALERTIPPAFRWARLDAPELTSRVDPPAAIAAARGVVREPCLLFRGPSGAGKTSLAVALLRERVRATGEPALMSLAFQLSVARIQHRAGEGEAPPVAAAMRAPMLLLDDIGQEQNTAVNPIADIVQHRWAHELPTWVTTGLSREELGARYGGGVARRLFERARILRLGPRDDERAHRDLKPANMLPGVPFDAAATRAGET